MRNPALPLETMPTAIAVASVIRLHKTPHASCHQASHRSAQLVTLKYVFGPAVEASKNHLPTLKVTAWELDPSATLPLSVIAWLPSFHTTSPAFLE